jgi:hypothetical protein
MFAMDRATDGVGGIYLQRRDSSHAYKGTLFRYLDTQGWTFGTASSTTATNTTDHFYINPAGNVGVGVSNPSYKLDINGSTRIVGDSEEVLRFQNGSTSNVQSIEMDSSRFYIYNRTAGEFNSIAVLNSGSVGIGTTSPQRKLHVSTGNTDIAARFENTTSNGTVMELLASGDSTTMYFQTDHIYSSSNLYLGAGTKITHYRGSDHRFQYGSSNTEAMRIDSSGNLGIGVASPAFSWGTRGIEIQGSGVNPAIRLDRSDSIFEITARGGDILLYNTGTARSLRFGVGGGEKFRINSDGNAYFYQTAIINSNDHALMGRDTGGTVRNLIKLDSSNRVQVGDASTTGVHHHYPSTYSQINTDHGYLQIGPQNVSHCHYTTDRANHWFNQMIYVNGGVVSSYNSNLSLRRNGATSDSISIEDNAVKVYTDATNERFRFGSANRSFNDIIVGPINNNSKAWIRANNGYSNQDNPDFTFYYDDKTGISHPAGSVIGFNTGQVERLRITNQGITFSQNGSAAAPAMSWTSDPDLGFYRNGNNNMRFSAGNSIRGTWNGDGLVLNGGSLGVNVAIPTTDGVIRAGNDVIAYYSSDERLKENVKPIENAIDKVSKIRGVEFDWIVDKEIHDNEGHDVGVIAQEVEKVLPEVVQTRDNGYKAVKYEKIVSLLIEAVNEQQQQINKLQEKLNG